MKRCSSAGLGMNAVLLGLGCQSPSRRRVVGKIPKPHHGTNAVQLGIATGFGSHSAMRREVKGGNRARNRESTSRRITEWLRNGNEESQPGHSTGLALIHSRRCDGRDNTPRVSYVKRMVQNYFGSLGRQKVDRVHLQDFAENGEQVRREA